MQQPHYEVITGDGQGGYNLAGDWQLFEPIVPEGLFSPLFVHISRLSNGAFDVPEYGYVTVIPN